MKLELGKYNRLRILKKVDFGMYLDGGNGMEILLPLRYVPQNAGIGDEIEVFVYRDNEERLIATTEHPYGVAGEFQWLKVKELSAAGAFLDWGIMKDLLVPYREQKTEMKTGHYYLVYIYIDFISKRITASARIDKFLDNIPPDYEYNQEVDLVIADETALGYKVIINHSHWGLIYKNEIFQSISKGEKYKGYIKEVREDDKIDVSLSPLGYDKIEGISQKIMNLLAENNGYLDINDKSEASQINSLLSCSKKSFKKAIGALYKQRLITIDDCGIRATTKPS
ncbi:MAG: GntR family transcriptional regulator [Tannerella sp.]|jgi:predicted RNA-binding protein (virulence factor B family)|nr:GntR family transcriptional regulator [Tannerella sp.]